MPRKRKSADAGGERAEKTVDQHYLQGIEDIVPKILDDCVVGYLKMARKEMCVARQQLGGRHQAFIDHEQVRKHEKYDQNDRNGVFGDIIAGLFPLLAPFDFRNELRLSRGYNLFFHQSSPSPYWIHLPVLNMTRVSAAMMTNRIHAMAHASP